MAIDNNSLCYLFDSIFQVENIAGRPVVGGHIEVFVAGTDQKYITWQNFDGTKNPFKIPLNNDGRAVVLVEPHYTYDIYIYDSFNNMICSRLNVKPAIGGDVTVYGLTEVWHDDTMSGEGTPQSPLSVVSAGKVYDGIEPIVVNNIENKISAQHIPLGVQDPLYFVEDSETACIIGCSAQTEIPAELSGKWDEASNAVIANSAQWGEGTEYEAGSYIDIDGHTISVTGLQPEGDYAYNSALSSKLDVTALPQDLVHSGDLTAYQPVGNYQTAGNYLSATDSANFYPIDNPSGFITGVDLTDYATTAQLDEKLDKTDSGNFYPMEGNPSGFLTAHQSLQGYATEQWVEDKGYITGVEIPESATWNATTETVSSNSAQWGASNPQIPVTGINGIKISESGDKVVFEVSGDYYPGNNPSGFITGVDLSDYATTAQVSEKLDTTAFSTVSGDFLTAVDLTPYQEKEEMTAYATVESLTAKQDAGDYLSASDSANFLLTSDSGNFYTTANESGFITGVDLTPYQLTADMTAYQQVGDYLTTADSANFYTTANESGYLTAIPDTYLQNTDLSTEDGKVTAISGIPLSAGGDVPEGVMVESGLEYNAVNEISGYNGSAIAQYGAEKQWLVHDDTLVHASNSAQYALGVNLSAVAQLLGVDETVLWEGNIPMTPGSTAKCSESIYNFKRVKFLYNASADNEYQHNSNYTVETDQTSATNRISWQDGFTIGNNWYNRYYNRFTVTNGTDLTLTNANCYWGYTAEAGNSLTGHAGNFYKIIGIGRKA